MLSTNSNCERLDTSLMLGADVGLFTGSNVSVVYLGSYTESPELRVIIELIGVLIGGRSVQSALITRWIPPS